MWIGRAESGMGRRRSDGTRSLNLRQALLVGDTGVEERFRQAGHSSPGHLLPPDREVLMRFRSGRWFASVLVLGCGLLPGVAAGGGAQEKGRATTAVTDKAKIQGTYTLSPEKLQRAIEYSRTRTRIQFLDQGWSALVLLLLLTTGGAAWMQRRALRASGNRWAQAGVFVLLLLAVTTLLGLPIDAYGHHVSLQYGQSVQHWPSWFGDLAKSFGLTYLLGVPLVMLLFWAIRRSTQRWWFWFWVPTVLATVIGVFIGPLFIDPWSKKSEPRAKPNPARRSRD